MSLETRLQKAEAVVSQWGPPPQPPPTPAEWVAMYAEAAAAGGFDTEPTFPRAFEELKACLGPPFQAENFRTVDKWIWNMVQRIRTGEPPGPDRSALVDLWRWFTDNHVRLFGADYRDGSRPGRGIVWYKKPTPGCADGISVLTLFICIEGDLESGVKPPGLIEESRGVGLVRHIKYMDKLTGGHWRGDQPLPDQVADRPPPDPSPVPVDSLPDPTDKDLIPARPEPRPAPSRPPAPERKKGLFRHG